MFEQLWRTGVRLVTMFGCVVASACSSAEPADENTMVDSKAEPILVQTYAQQAYVKASNTGAGDAFSDAALSADGNTLAVGACGESSNASGVNGAQGNDLRSLSGAVYVFTRSGGAWVQQAYLKASNPSVGDSFCSVAISGDGNTLAVGAMHESSSATGVNGDQLNDLALGSGAVYVFTRSSNVWTQQAYIKASNTGAFDGFGISVALSTNGSTLAVGAWGEDGNATGVNGNQANNALAESGAVYVFTRASATWTQQAYIKASNTGASDGFGIRIALSGDGNRLAATAPGEASAAAGINGNQTDNSAGSSGATYVFARSGSVWAQEAYIKASNTGAADGFGASVSLSTDGATLAVGAYAEGSDATFVNGDQSNDAAPGSGAAYVYSRSGTTWNLQAYVKAPNTEMNDLFWRVALSGDGNALAVAALGESSSATGINGNQSDNSAYRSGALYVYGRSGGSWAFRDYIKTSNAEAEDRLGERGSVALSSDGSTLVAGAFGEDGGDVGINGLQSDNSASLSGAVYVFNRVTVQVFDQQAYVKASNTQASDGLGYAMALSGDGNTLVVGADKEDSSAAGIGGDQSNNSATSSGAVYVYTRVAGTWTQQAYLKASNAAAGDRFGFAVAVSADGNTIAVGAALEDSAATGINGNQGDNSSTNSGAVYVFSRTSGVWSQQAYIKASNTGAGDYFGASVTLSANGNTLGVGAAFEDSAATGINGIQSSNAATDSGAAYVFVRSGGVWSQQAYIKASNTGAGDNFFFQTLSGDGNTLAIVAYGEDSAATGVNGSQSSNAATDSGAAYIFTRSGTTWTQQAYIKATNTGAGDGLGSSLAISSNGSTLAIGAFGEDSSAMGIGGNRDDNSAADSGAVYVLTRTGSTWTHQAYIKASNTGAGDSFGDWVAMSSDGSTLAISASKEDSDAIGVNDSNQGSDAATDSGAVYLFSRVGSTWTQRSYLKASNTQANDLFGGVVGLSADGSTLAVAAIGEDSSATGINGAQFSNAASGSGAVYAFVR